MSAGRECRPLLEVDDLAVSFDTPAGVIRAVDGVSLSIAPGERIGLVGESGAGKSVTALAILGLLRSPPARVTGRVSLEGTDLLGLPARGLREIRGARIAMVFQEPAACLSPRMTAGAQIVEAIRAHGSVPRSQARERAVDLLARVGIPTPRRWADEYPHRLSGGMAQRVMIAIALACSPDVIIADEPTTALDVTIEAQIIDLLLSVCEEEDAAVLLITHDLALEARFAERLLVMYAGRIVERGSTTQVFERPAHPYTRGLLASITRPDRPTSERLRPIRGSPPSALAVPPGCAFHPRCPHAEERCREEVPALRVREGTDHPAACHLVDRLPRAGPVTTGSGAGPPEAGS